MRSVAIGLIGAVLTGGVAQAATCKPGATLLTKGTDTLKVAALSNYEQRKEWPKASRTLLRGTMKDKPFVVDLQNVQGNSAFLTSYAGRQADAGGMPVRWGARSVSWLSDGKTFDVEDGPLKGTWQAVCH